MALRRREQSNGVATERDTLAGDTRTAARFVADLASEVKSQLTALENWGEVSGASGSSW